MVTIREFKLLFFDRRPIIAAAHRGVRDAMRRPSLAIRLRARRLMRPARQKPFSEMTAEERRRYAIAVFYARKAGGKKPRRPFAHSKPGEPPRVIVGHVKRLLFAGWDSKTQTAVIGPAYLPGAPRQPTTPQKLEAGATRLKPRPYMLPSLKAELPNIPRQFVGVVRAR